jgi:hypothetical protein
MAKMKLLKYYSLELSHDELDLITYMLLNSGALELSHDQRNLTELLLEEIN